MKTLFIESFSGISGDMFLGAMADLGVDKIHIVNELKKLNLEGWSVDFMKSDKMGIFGTRAIVKDLSTHTHENSKKNFVLPNTLQINLRQHDSHTHSSHRGYSDIKKIIESSTLNNNIKAVSLKIFKIIGEAEAKIHNKTLNEIHFHEVGAIDSIVDIVGAAICIDYLKPEKIIASRVELGGGFVKCAHGTFPVPAPATAEILKGIPVKTGTVQSETTTPTGAAILAGIVNEFADSFNFSIEKTAYGIGFKDFNIPNVLRVHWGQVSNSLNDIVVVVECNIDDMNPEIYGSIFDKLFEIGALDVYTTAITMKKSRPATKISVLCKKSNLENINKYLLSETTTIGIRYFEAQRTILDRSFVEIETKYGKVKIKIASGEGVSKFKPEYEHCIQLAQKHKIPVSEIINEAIAIYQKNK